MKAVILRNFNRVKGVSVSGANNFIAALRNKFLKVLRKKVGFIFSIRVVLIRVNVIGDVL